jgi:WD40 repeat protein
MHTAAIRRLDGDAQSRFLVTASYDKTARVWSLASGRMQRRISGLPNVIHHLAYTPDGRFLAATLGGLTAFGSMRRATIEKPHVTSTMAPQATGPSSTAVVGW